VGRLPRTNEISCSAPQGKGWRRGLRGAMRILLLATAACMMLLASAPAMALDCAAVRAACFDQCQNVAGATGQLNPVTGVLAAGVQACFNRCLIAPCQQTPLAARLCDATGQAVCNRSFRSCTDACTPSTAATEAIIQNQASCTTSCCTVFKNCLASRQCDIRTITAINCEPAGNQ
jgi:hypothetical protein